MSAPCASHRQASLQPFDRVPSQSLKQLLRSVAEGLDAKQAAEQHQSRDGTFAPAQLPAAPLIMAMRSVLHQAGGHGEGGGRAGTATV